MILKTHTATALRCKDTTILNDLLRICVIVSLCFIFAACIPAHVPDNLDDTPGPPVIITGDLYEGSQFSARYPNGWRVITSEANAPPSVIFVAPDESATIQLVAGTLNNTNFPDSSLQTDIRGLTLEDGEQVTAILRAPAAEWDTVYATI